jgi:hypothetical protein
LEMFSVGIHKGHKAPADAGERRGGGCIRLAPSFFMSGLGWPPGADRADGHAGSLLAPTSYEHDFRNGGRPAF